jgi:hypothetical protein
MPPKKQITPSQVAMQFDWDINQGMAFAADLLEDMNAHNLAAVLRALDLEQYDIAKEFIDIEKEHRAEGGLSPELMARREALYNRLREFGQE